MLKKIALSLIVLLCLCAGLIMGYVTKELSLEYSGPTNYFIIEPGDTFGKINQHLYDQGFISNKRLFHYYGKYHGWLEKFKAGTYEIKSGSKIENVFQQLVFGTPILLSVTLPEGKNMYEMAKIFEEKGFFSAQDFLQAAQDEDLLSAYQIPAENLEGYLYPETYKFAPKTPAKTVVKAMVQLFFQKTKDIPSHPELNRHQLIILASMVEKETGAKFEQKTIAGVFHNRLKKKMRLESDPTTIYGIWDRYQGNLKKSDLQTPTPYNTYKIPALPIGPICNPSLEAVKAVLEPEVHNFLFFVSRNDGTHVFTENYQSHTEAVINFQKNPRARSGKSWRDLKQEN